MTFSHFPSSCLLESSFASIIKLELDLEHSLILVEIIKWNFKSLSCSSVLNKFSISNILSLLTILFLFNYFVKEKKNSGVS